MSDDYRRIPDCKVSVDGKKVDGVEDAELAKVDVDLDIDLFGQCVLTFNDPKLKLMNGTQFKPGTAIKVDMGFHTQLATVFEGEVVALEPQFRRDMPPSLKVVCQESIHRLALSQMTRSFNNVDDKEIVTKIAQEHGLSAEAPSGSKEHILQSNVSDAVFLRRLAQKHGNHLRIEGKKLIVGPPPRGEDVFVKPGEGLKKIKVKIKAGMQLSEVAVHGWDPKTKKEFKGSAKGEGEIGKGARDFGGSTQLAVASHEVPPIDVATAEKMAQGRMRKLAEGFTVGHVNMVGHPDVIPGAMVTLDKLGDKIDGAWRVETAHHEFSKHGYWVNFRAVRVGKKAPPKAPPAPKDAKGDDDKDGSQRGGGKDHKGKSKDKDQQELQKRKHPDIKHLKLDYEDGFYQGNAAEEEAKEEALLDRRSIENLELSYEPHEGSEVDPNADKEGLLHKLSIAKLKLAYQEQTAAERAAAKRPPEIQKKQVIVIDALALQYREHVQTPEERRRVDPPLPRKLPDVEGLALAYRDHQARRESEEEKKDEPEVEKLPDIEGLKLEYAAGASAAPAPAKESHRR